VLTATVRGVQIEVVQEETLAPPTLEDAVAQHDTSALAEATATRDESTLFVVVAAVFYERTETMRAKAALPRY
jgi:hypothetical protein